MDVQAAFCLADRLSRDIRQLKYQVAYIWHSDALDDAKKLAALQQALSQAKTEIIRVESIIFGED